MRSLAPLVALVALAACSSTSGPHGVTPPDPPGAASAAPAAPDTPTAASTNTTSPPPTTITTVSAISTTTSPTTVSAISTTTSPTTSTLPAAVREACRSLSVDPYDTRSQTYESLDDIEAVRGACPTEVASVVAARRVESLVAEFDGSRAEDTESTLDCDAPAGTVTFILTNSLTFPLGTFFLPAVATTDADGVDTVRTSTAPGVTLTAAPGTTVRTVVDVPKADSYDTCRFTVPFFISDDPTAPGDGSRPIDRDAPPQSIGDADRWFAELIRLERAHRSAADTTSAFDFVDIHSTLWPKGPSQTFTAYALRDLAEDAQASYEVCDVAVTPESERHAVVTFARTGEVTDEDTGEVSVADTAYVGLLRRGDDGRWRWLTPVDRLSDDLATCEQWRSVAAER